MKTQNSKIGKFTPQKNLFTADSIMATPSMVTPEQGNLMALRTRRSKNKIIFKISLRLTLPQGLLKNINLILKSHVGFCLQNVLSAYKELYGEKMPVAKQLSILSYSKPLTSAILDDGCACSVETFGTESEIGV